MVNLAKILALSTKSLILVSCEKIPEGHRKVTIREDGFLDYAFLKYVAGQDYVRVENPDIYSNVKK